MAVCLTYLGSVSGNWAAYYVVKQFAAIWSGVWEPCMSKRQNWLTTSLASA